MRVEREPFAGARAERERREIRERVERDGDEELSPVRRLGHRDGATCTRFSAEGTELLFHRPVVERSASDRGEDAGTAHVPGSPAARRSATTASGSGVPRPRARSSREVTSDPRERCVGGPAGFPERGFASVLIGLVGRRRLRRERPKRLVLRRLDRRRMARVSARSRTAIALRARWCGGARHGEPRGEDERAAHVPTLTRRAALYLFLQESTAFVRVTEREADAESEQEPREDPQCDEEAGHERPRRVAIS